MSDIPKQGYPQGSGPDEFVVYENKRHGFYLFANSLFGTSNLFFISLFVAEVQEIDGIVGTLPTWWSGLGLWATTIAWGLFDRIRTHSISELTMIARDGRYQDVKYAWNPAFNSKTCFRTVPLQAIHPGKSDPDVVVMTGADYAFRVANEREYYQVPKQGSIHDGIWVSRILKYPEGYILSDAQEHELYTQQLAQQQAREEQESREREVPQGYEGKKK